MLKQASHRSELARRAVGSSPTARLALDGLGGAADLAPMHLVATAPAAAHRVTWVACERRGLPPAPSEDAALVAGLLVLLAIPRTHAGVRARTDGPQPTVRSPAPPRLGDPAAAIAGAYSLALVTRPAASFGVRRGSGEQLLRAPLNAPPGPPTAAPGLLAGASA